MDEWDALASKVFGGSAKTAEDDPWDAIAKKTITKPGIAVIPGTPPQPNANTEPSTGTAAVADILLGAKGSYEAGKSILSGIPAGLWAAMVETGTGMKPGNYGTNAGVARGTEAGTKSLQANAYQPQSQEGQDYLRSIGNATQSMPAFIGHGADLSNIAALAKPAVAQAKQSLVPKIDPEVAKLAMTAGKYGIPLRPDMLGKNKFAKVFGNFAESDVPLAFSKAGNREDAFVNAITKQIDPESTATRLTDNVYSSAMNKAGTTIGDIAARTPVDAIGLEQSIKSVVREAKPYGQDTSLLVSARARDLKNLINDGVINGTEFKQWNSKVLQDMRNANDITQSALGKLQETAMNAFEKSLSPEDLPVWKASRQQYAVGKQLLPLVAKSPTGEISPASLMANVTRGKDAQNRMAYGSGGDIGELAKIGQQFLKEPAFGSMPERIATYGLLGAVGREAAGAAIYPVAAAYNWLSPSISRSIVRNQPNILGRSQALPYSIAPATLRAQLNENWLGDLTPDWTTSKGVGQGRQGIDPSGMVRALGEEPPLPQGFQRKPGSMIPAIEPAPLGDLTPEWTTSKGLLGRQEGIPAQGMFRLPGEDPLVSSRNKGRPQMPVQPGLLNVDDTVISGPGFNDAATGAPNRLEQRPRFTTGQGAVTNEAANRFAQEQAAGQFRYLGNQDASNIRKLTNPTDVDLKPGRGQIVVQKGIGKAPYTEIARGEGVTDGMVARFIAKLIAKDKEK